VSLSHSLGRVAVALSDVGPVGIDLEVPRRFPETVARRWLSADEYAWFDSFSGAARLAAFFEVFTMKEAFSKCSGVALWRTPEVPVPICDPRRVSTSVWEVTWGRLRVSHTTAVALCVRTGRDIAVDVVRIDPREALAGV
jgi:phosphopantetheine--protein transferase-like protein